MGQYYNPIILEKDNRNKPVKSWYSHEFGSGLKLTEHSFINNVFVANVEYFLLDNPQPLVWEGDYADDTLYDEAENLNTPPQDFDFNSLKDTYVVNHEKKQFYKRPQPSDETWVVNPLPLLTSEGNGRGSGDYYTDDIEEMELIGSWARNVIELTNAHPTEEYTEIYPSFTVDY